MRSVHLVATCPICIFRILINRPLPHYLCAVLQLLPNCRPAAVFFGNHKLTSHVKTCSFKAFRAQKYLYALPLLSGRCLAELTAFFKICLVYKIRRLNIIILDPTVCGMATDGTAGSPLGRRALVRYTPGATHFRHRRIRFFHRFQVRRFK
ncbi:hypothetical protein SAMN05216327_11467 [Dyadobacter sp. SG02]|nr:hypothetical protein SAMN05216327_11467 [Dyadobacter sp. SG02]